MQKKTITLSNKENYAYLEYGSKDHDTLLLVHGNMSSGVHYEPLIDLLKTDFHILAPDLRGFGDSSYGKPIESLDDFADDLRLLLDKLDIDTVHFVGWSTGGGIGMKFAAKYPTYIKKLILVESASYRGYPIFEKNEAYQPILGKLYKSKEAMAKDPVQVLPIQQAIEQNDSEFIKKIWTSVIYNVNVPNETSFNRYITETLKQRNLIDVDWALMTFNMSDSSNGVVKGDGSIKAVKAPVLSVWGKKDFVIPEPMFKETVDALSQVTTHVFDEGSHSPITDVPDELAGIIKDFIKG